jgi:HSP20 family protein
MSAVIYEPFYDFDRFFNSFTPNLPIHRHSQEGDGAVRALKPWYACIPIHFTRHLIFVSMDLHENTESNTVTATFEFPGFKKEDVQIDMHNGKLTVAAESQIASEREESGYAVRERRYGKFSRTLQLPLDMKVSVLH